jgi:pimeloyl-ACP methyl ester carboxylesterase
MLNIGSEHKNLICSNSYNSRNVPDGEGTPVLLVQGFGAPRLTLSKHYDWFQQNNYRPYYSKMKWNIHEPEQAIQIVENDLINIFLAHNKRVIILGHSYGGALGRIVANRNPDKTEVLFTMGSPIDLPIGINPYVFFSPLMPFVFAANAIMYGQQLLYDLHPHKLEAFLEELLLTPSKVPGMALYSETDAIVMSPTSSTRRDMERYKVVGPHCSFVANQTVTEGLIDGLTHLRRH